MMNDSRKELMIFSPSGRSLPRLPQEISDNQTKTPAASRFHRLPGRRQLKVTFLSVQVTKDGSWGLWRDTRWRFYFSVNGEVRSLIKDVNEGDPPFPIDFSFIVDASAPGSSLTVLVGGKESDWGSAPLPFGIAIWKAENNYGLGMHSLYATSRDVSYEATYRITCAQRKVCAQVFSSN